MFKIFEGEHEKHAENHYLGEFELWDLPERPRGEVKFTMTLNLDENGILNCTAFQKDNEGKSGSVKIKQDAGRFTEA